MTHFFLAHAKNYKMGKKNYAVEKPQIRETARGWHIEYLLTAPDGSSTRRRPAFNLNSIEDLAVRRMVAERIVEALPDMIIVVEATPPVPQEHAIYIYAALELMVDEMYTKGRTTAKGNYRTAASHLRRWLQKENIGDCLLGAIGKTQARQFRQHLQRSGLSARTAKNYTDCLNTMWNDLPEMGIEVPNPWAKMPRTRPVPKKRRTYTAEEKRIVVAELEKHYWLYRALLLLYYCGVRRNEMCRLRFSDIDLEKGIIHIYDHAAKNYRTRHATIPAAVLPQHHLQSASPHPGRDCRSRETARRGIGGLRLLRLEGYRHYPPYPPDESRQHPQPNWARLPRPDHAVLPCPHGERRIPTIARHLARIG